MNYFSIICGVLSGLGVFLVGCKLLSDNMEKLATKRIRSLFLKTSDKKIVGLGIGCVTTALVQSSGLTTVMVIGLVNAGIMTLFQAGTIIIGANIGTTITAHIASLQSFDFIGTAVAITGIGALINVFTNKEKVKTIGNILSGLGLIFVGLILMQDAMKVLADPAQGGTFVVDLLTSIKNPFVLFIIGIVFTALIQSSSAITSIIISMAAAGILIGGGGNAVLFIILGSNIGSCATSLLSSIGASTNAKRSSIIHILFNTFGAVIFFVLLMVWEGFMDDTFAVVFKEPATQIAMFHTFFNVVCAVIFLPLTKVLVRLSEIIIKDKKQETRISYIDDRFLNTPPIAVMQATREVAYLGGLAMKALDLSLEGLLKRDTEYKTKVFEKIDNIEECNKNIITYLVKLSSGEVSLHDEKKISNLHSIINDFIREAEIADNVVKHTRTMMEKDITFSEEVEAALCEIKDLLTRQFENVEAVMIKKDYSVLSSVNKIEDRIDEMRIDLTNGHIKRLEEGKCQPHSSGVFINLISNLERAGDHLNYIVELLTTK